MELKFRHRFYGSLFNRPVETLFGIREGANVEFGARFSPISRLDVGFDYVMLDDEPSVTVCWALPSSRANFTFTATAYTWLSGFEQRSWGGMVYAAVETKPLFGVTVPAIGIWFKPERLEFGGHISIRASIPLDSGIVESVDALVEVLPQYAFRLADNAGLNRLNAQPGINAGLGISTWGHHLMVTLGNTFESGRRALTGASEGTGWYLGFALHRLIRIY